MSRALQYGVLSTLDTLREDIEDKEGTHFLANFSGRRWELPFPVVGDQFNDPLNFHLNDRALSICIAVVTGLLLLILSDLTYRIVVRAPERYITSHMVYRRFLLSTSSNPIQWPSLCRNLAGFYDREKNHEVDEKDWNGATRQFRRLGRQSILVVVAGLLLLIFELLLIFLNTTREVPVTFDARKLPAFSFQFSGKRQINTNPVDTCLNFPITKEPGFFSAGQVQICHMYSVRNLAPPTDHVPKPRLAFLGFTLQDYQLSIHVILGASVFTTVPSIRVSFPNGTSYKVRSTSSQDSAKSAVLAAMDLWGYTVLTNMSSVSGSGEASWNVSIAVDLQRKGSVSFNDGKRVVQAGWDSHFMAILENLLVINSSDRAFLGDGVTGPFLDEMSTDELVLHRRPWMSLGLSLILLCSSIFAWIFVSFHLKWSYGVDERYAWVDLFPVISVVQHLSSKFPEQYHSS